MPGGCNSALLTLVRDRLVNGIENAIFQYPVPASMVGKAYVEVLTAFASYENAVIIGLYRTVGQYPRQALPPTRSLNSSSLAPREFWVHTVSTIALDLPCVV